MKRFDLQVTTARFLFLALLLVQSAGIAAADARQAGAERAESGGYRLSGSTSTYLRQHADDFVAWHEWNENAFKKAQAQNKLIFLSVGYSSCHWCHVMERESFEDETTASLLNEHFISILVDRERRPDLDEVYTSAMLLETGRAGHPINGFLTPDGKPFFTRSYIPKSHFQDGLQQANKLWREQPQVILNRGAQMNGAIAAVQQLRGTPGDSTLNASYFEQVNRLVIEQADPLRGGFGNQSKFPYAPLLLYLLEQAARTPDEQQGDALRAVARRALDAMAAGGMHDHVGGGFFRYTVDPDWNVPHFEKMLYDQAELAMVYLAAGAWLGEPVYFKVAANTLDFVLRELSDPNGGFRSALDADSEKVEGKFYLFERETIERILSAQELDELERIFYVDGRPSLHDKIALRVKPELGIKESLRFVYEANSKLQGSLAKLLKFRENRIRPTVDEKVPTAWNGLLLSALVRASVLLEREEYGTRANELANYLLAKHVQQGGTDAASDKLPRLPRALFQGGKTNAAMSEDYALLARAFLDMFQLSGEEKWRKASVQLIDELIQHYWDAERGLFRTAALSTQDRRVPVTFKVSDTPYSSANAIAFEVLLRLSKLHFSKTHAEVSAQLGNRLAASSEQSPRFHGAFLRTAAKEKLENIDYHRLAARGKVRVDAQVLSPDSDPLLRVVVKVAPGWHINSDQPNQPDYIATRLSASGIGAIEYPAPQKKRLQFEDQDLLLLEGEFSIDAPLSRLALAERKSVELTLQACSDEICLPPETLKIVPRYGMK